MPRKRSPADIKDSKGKAMLIKKGEAFTKERINAVSFDRLREVEFKDKELAARIAKIIESKDNQLEIIRLIYEDKINKIKKGDELPPGVIRTIKVYVAMKTKGCCRR